jgi:hypothetical protein
LLDVRIRRPWGAGGWIAALALAVVALLAAAPAQAKPHRLVIPGSFELLAMLPKSHGYTVSIASTGHRHIELKASKGALVATYRVIGRANHNRLDADFGRFGHVSLRFHAPQHKRDGSLQLCPGKPAAREVGTMRGSVRFSGAKGLPTVSTTRVHAVATRSFRQVCNFGHHGGGNPSAPEVTDPHPHPHQSAARLVQRLVGARLGGDKPEVTLEALVAKRQTPSGLLEFAALSIPEFLMIVFAAERETVGRVHISRGALEIASPGMLKLSKRGAQPREATVKAPKPFAGRGKYVEIPGGDPSWNGSLRVPIPGEGTVSLTGPEFDVQTCEAQTKKETDACLELAEP